MTMTGMFRIALLPNANEQKFVNHMVKKVFDVLQATRITSGFTHTLLKANDGLRHYAWAARVELVTDAGYDFAQNVERVQKSIAKFGVLIDVDAYIHMEEII
jgi:hypothetical protein